METPLNVIFRRILFIFLCIKTNSKATLQMIKFWNQRCPFCLEELTIRSSKSRSRPVNILNVLFSLSNPNFQPSAKVLYAKEQVQSHRILVLPHRPKSVTAVFCLSHVFCVPQSSAHRLQLFHLRFSAADLQKSAIQQFRQSGLLATQTALPWRTQRWQKSLLSSGGRIFLSSSSTFIGSFVATSPSRFVIRIRWVSATTAGLP